jgi:hypothetical protein
MNTRIKSMKQLAIATLAIVIFTLIPAQAQSPARKIVNDSFTSRADFGLDLFRFLAGRESLSARRPAGFRLMPEASARINAGPVTVLATGPKLQVLGSGTLGRLTKWTGFTSSNSVIGDSTIFEDKFGKVGIGTDSLMSRLTVAGMIETTLGGLKFPDGTVQTTSAATALFSVAHDVTLTGDGTSGSPLGVAIPLNLSGATGAEVLAVQNLGIGDNRFTIKTSAANVKVSWQVTGIRQDPYANKNRIKVEEEKPERERRLLPPL